MRGYGQSVIGSASSAAPATLSMVGAARSEVVNVLEADPELASELRPASASAARRYALARVRTLPPGPWRPVDRGSPTRRHLGLLVVDGLLARELDLGGRGSVELFGRGDLLRPWDEDGDAPLPVASSWSVLAPARLAVLDESFAVRVARCPGMIAAIAGRVGQRGRWLALHLLICQANGVQLRLLMLLWVLAERWGRVGLDGTIVPVDLPHSLLAKLIGARRPTVTTALVELTRRGSIARRPSGSWVLVHHPEELRRVIADAERVGMPRQRRHGAPAS